MNDVTAMNASAQQLHASPLFAPFDPYAVSDGNGTVESSFTRRDLLELLFKHWGLILGLWLVVTAAAVAALLYLPPSYTAEAKLLIKTDQQGRPSLLSGITPYRDVPDTDPSSRKLETEMELLLSRPLAEQVVETLDLRYDQIYQPPVVHLMAPVGDAIAWFKMRFMGAPPPDKRRFDATVDGLLKSLNVAPAKSRSGEAAPNFIVVKIIAADAATAQQALATILTLYQQYSTSLDQQDSERIFKALQARTDEAAAQMKDAQQRYDTFSARGLSDAPMMASSLVLRSSQSSDGVDEPVSMAAMAEPAPAETVSALLRRRLIQLQLDLAEQQQIYTPRMESVVNLKANIASVQARLSAELTKTARENGESQGLQHALRLAEDHYFELERKLTQIGVFLQVNPEQASTRILVEPPRRPGTSEWRKSVLIGLLASVAGLLLGLAMATFREFADHRLTREADVATHVGLPTLAVVERLSNAQLHDLRAGAGRSAS